MSGNPNNVKLGKRRPFSNSNTPGWLFPDKPNPNATPIPVIEDKAKDKKAKLVADELLKRRAAGETKHTIIHPQVANLVEDFLIDHGLSNTIKTFKNELGNRVGKGDLSKKIPSLTALFHEWQNMKSNEIQNNKQINMSDSKKLNEKNASKKTKSKKQTPKSSSGSNNSDIEMEDAPPVAKKLSSPSSTSTSESGSEDGSESDTDTEAKVTTLMPNSTMPKTAGSKRKASTSEDSSSESDSTAAPKPKKIKRLPTSRKDSRVNSKPCSDSSSSEEESSSSSSDSESNDENNQKSSSSSDSSGSDSSGDDSSSSCCSLAKKTPLPQSESESSDSTDSDSDSSSSSDSDSKSPASKNPPKQGLAVSKKTPKTLKKIPAAPLPPDPIMKGKKTNQPFSRIPKDIKVNEKLASNAYVPYDYAQKAHEDLIITRGKGFTKEKNKKKRGSYRGGYIDVDGKKSVKFED